MLNFEEKVEIKLTALKNYLENNIKTCQRANENNDEEMFCKGELYAFQTALKAVEVTMEGIANDRSKKRNHQTKSEQ